MDNPQAPWSLKDPIDLCLAHQYQRLAEAQAVLMAPQDHHYYQVCWPCLRISHGYCCYPSDPSSSRTAGAGITHKMVLIKMLNSTETRSKFRLNSGSLQQGTNFKI